MATPANINAALFILRERRSSSFSITGIADNTGAPERLTSSFAGRYCGLDLLGVTCFEPTGGVVPIPSSILLLGSGLIGLAGYRKRLKSKPA